MHSIYIYIYIYNEFKLIYPYYKKLNLVNKLAQKKVTGFKRVGEGINRVRFKSSCTYVHIRFVFVYVTMYV